MGKIFNRIETISINIIPTQKLGIEMLPGSLFEALNAFESDDKLQSALGLSLTEAFKKARRAEWDAFRTSVTDWELERYLTTA